MNVADKLPCGTDMRVLTLACPNHADGIVGGNPLDVEREMRADWVGQKRLQGP